MTTPTFKTEFGRISPPRHEWLAKALPEPVIEPDLPIIDTHHHVWRDRGGYMLDEVMADMSGGGHNIVASVFIDCRFQYRTDGPDAMRSVGEVEAVRALADDCLARFPGRTKVAAGIVGYADLTLADRVEPVLEALAAAGGGRFRGVRNSAGFHDDPIIGNNHHGALAGHYLRKDFQAGLNVLTRMGLALDALVFHHQHADLLALARACPDANIIMNHCGMPLGYGPYAGKQSEVLAQWRQHMPAIAACPNVSIKLGGMMMRLASFDYMAAERPPTSAELADQWRPFIEPCIEWFGARRCTFESNFPVDKMGIGYTGIWNAFKRLSAGASTAEKHDLFEGTARRIYKLG